MRRMMRDKRGEAFNASIFSRPANNKLEIIDFPEEVKITDARLLGGKELRVSENTIELNNLELTAGKQAVIITLNGNPSWRGQMD